MACVNTLSANYPSCACNPKRFHMLEPAINTANSTRNIILICVSHFLRSEKGVRSTLVNFLYDLLLARKPFIKASFRLKQLLLGKLAISNISTILSPLLMQVSRGLSSERIFSLCIRPSVRAVRPSVPLLGEAQNLWFCIILFEIKKSPVQFYNT